MSKYGFVAELAVTLATEHQMSPPEAWAEAARRIFPDSETSQVKGCPKGAFLGLVAAGMVKGLPAGNYGRCSIGENAKYAAAAVSLIKEDPKIATCGSGELWLLSLKKVGASLEKRPNSQMDVVLKLHSLGLLL